MTVRRGSALRVVSVVAALAWMSGTPAAQRSAKPVTHQVTIDASSFAPADLSLSAGDTVVWTNKDVIPHTATDTAAKGFDSGTLSPGATWKRTFKAKGTIDYICTFHPTMKGRLKVK